MAEIPDPKKLSKIIDLCRKKGVESIEIDGIKLVLGSVPEPKKRKAKNISPEIQEEAAYSDEDILFWSAQGVPLNG